MMKSENIVITEPVTRPNRVDDIWESDAVWLYRDRPIKLYPSDSAAGASPEASPRLSKARLATIVDQLELLSDEDGVEFTMRSDSDGLVIARRIRLGWLVACARPDASQSKVTTELARFSKTVDGRFHTDDQSSDQFGDESTELMKGGRREPPTWAAIAANLNESIEGASGRFKMFAVKEWRRCGATLPLAFDLRTGFTARVDEQLGNEALIDLASVYGEWRARIEEATGELPAALVEQPEWMISPVSKAVSKE